MKLSGNIGFTKYSIEDAYVRIQERFSSAGAATVFHFGAQNEAMDGAPNRVVFVQADSELAPASKAGELGTLVDSCIAYCWGFAEGKDYSLDQHIAVKSLAVDVAAAFYLSFSGHTRWAQIVPANETRVLKYGEHYEVHMRLHCPIYTVDSSTNLAIARTTAAIGPR